VKKFDSIDYEDNRKRWNESRKKSNLIPVIYSRAYQGGKETTMPRRARKGEKGGYAGKQGGREVVHSFSA